MSLDDIERMRPEKIVISPGPCTPKEAGISCDVIVRFAEKMPILGVCLGHQCIGAAFGGEVIRAPSIMHGKLSDVSHDSQLIFGSIKNPFASMRHHLLVLNAVHLPPELLVTARTAANVIMGVRHKPFPVEGVQFHPESILTGEGKQLLKNFLDCYYSRHETSLFPGE